MQRRDHPAGRTIRGPIVGALLAGRADLVSGGPRRAPAEPPETCGDVPCPDDRAQAGHDPAAARTRRGLRSTHPSASRADGCGIPYLTRAADMLA